MTDRLEIKITGANQSSAAFQQVTRDATQMGSAVDQAGQKASRSLQDLSAKSALVGAAIGSATLVLGEWSRGAAEDAAGQARLQQSIENTGKSYDEYSEAVEKAIKAGQEKAFSDDATREALIKLNAVTNDSQASLDQLSLAMDFARARGISLASSAEIIAKVYGGNLGILSRYGIVLEENATAEEALAKIQQISAGQAETYADSQLGQLDKMKDRWGELTETIGASTGELQQFLLLLPGLSAGATAIAGLVGGVGGLGTIAKYAGPAALVVGGAGLAYGYSQDTLGTTEINKMANQFFMTMSSVLNELLPGNPYDTQKYKDQMATNANWDQINALLQAPGMSQDQVVNRLTGVLGVPWTYDEYGATMNYGQSGGSDPTGQWIPPTTDEVLAAASKGAAAAGIPIGDYIYKMLAADLNFVRDPVTGAFVTSAELAGYIAARDGRSATGNGVTGSLVSQYAPTSGLSITPTGNYDPAIYASIHRDQSMASMGAESVANSPKWDEVAQKARTRALTDALVAQYPAWEGIIRGIDSANDAQQAFAATQDALSAEMNVYQGQASEWTGQLNAQEAAYQILQERQQAGIELTQEQTEFMNQYAQATDIGNAAVADATVEAGILAQQLLLNKETGDQMNATLEGTNTVLGTLAEALTAYILTLEGVPEEVRTELILNNDPAMRSLYDFLGLIPTSVTIPMYVSGQQVLDFMGGGSRLGGVVGYRNGGIPVELAEAGPELLHFRNGGSAWAMDRGVYNVPKGTYVDTAPASKLKAASPGMTFQINAPITVIANDPRDFGNALHEFAIGGSRA